MNRPVIVSGTSKLMKMGSAVCGFLSIPSAQCHAKCFLVLITVSAFYVVPQELVSALNFTFLPCMFFQTISINHRFPAIFKHILKPQLFMCCYLHSLILPSAGSRSGSPGRVLTTTTLSTMNTGVQRVLVNPAAAQKRSKIPRSQGCSREASPSRLSVGKN